MRNTGSEQVAAEEAVRARDESLLAAQAVRPPGSFVQAAETLERYLARAAPAARHVLLCHSDADGLAAGVVLLRALERLGRPDVRLLVTGKGESAWSAGTLRQVARTRPDLLFVLDLGSRPQPIFPGVATLLIDHHRPTGIPPGAGLISSNSWEPTLCTAALMYWLGLTLADIGDLDWMAAVGIIGDLGERAHLDPLPEARKRFGGRTLRETCDLVNAARRSATGDATPALQALLEAREPADIASERLEPARTLAALRQAFNQALAEAKRAGPALSGRIALIRVRSPYQVHPVLARIWSARLPNYVVMVANEGYLPDRVNFSVRTALDISLLDFLQAFRPGVDATEMGYGHDHATGGSLRVEEWKRLLATLGF